LTGLAIVAVGVFCVDWDEKVGPGDYIVGGGTLALALGTLWLARQTARQADLTKQSVEDAERPYVIATPHEDRPEGLTFETSMHNLHFYYRLWNIGRGPALVFNVGLQENDQRELITFATPRALATGGAADFKAELATHTVPLPSRFTLRVVYQDGSRRTYMTTQELVREGETMIVSPLWFDARRLEPAELKGVIERMKA
jgi:hypothetical protein